MKSVLAWIVAASATLTSAASADPWNGAYFGINIGYSLGRSDTDFSFVDGATNGVLSGSNAKFNLNGVIGGAQVGYAWRRSTWIWGFEADLQASGQKGSGNAACAGGSLAQAPATLFSGACTPGHVGDTAPFNRAAVAVDSVLNQRLEWFGTARGRFGTMVTPTVAVYGTGGLAFGRLESTNTISGVNITGPQGTNTVVLTPVFGSSSKSSGLFGYTLGAGVEGVMVGNWTGKIEYLYIDLGDVSGSFATPITTISGAVLVSRYSSHITDHILRIGVNYSFNGLP